jgi:small subunit ribosomal protein S4
MGDPRKLTNKYETPRKVWDADRIKTDKRLSTTYGLKNTREVWRALQHLKTVRRNAIKLLSQGKEGEEKSKPILARLTKLGILGPDATLQSVLEISVESFLDRRLQSRVMKKGLARTANQARQLITHGYISVKGKRVTAPSYMVNSEEDSYVAYFKPIDISVKEPVAPKAKQEQAPAAESAA